MTQPHTTVFEKRPGEYEITLTFRDNAKLEKDISEKSKELAEARATIAGKDRELAEARASIAGKDRELAEARATIAGKDRELAEERGKISENAKEIEEKSDKVQSLVTQNKISELCFDEAVRDLIELKRKIEELEGGLAGNRAAKRAAHGNQAGGGCSSGDIIVID